MADKKISELTQLSGADASQTDEIVINDVNAGSGGVTVTKRITLGSLKTALGSIDNSNPGTGGGFTPAFLNLTPDSPGSVDLKTCQRRQEGSGPTKTDTTGGAPAEVGTGGSESSDNFDPYGRPLGTYSSTVTVPSGATSAVVIFLASEKVEQKNISDNGNVVTSIIKNITIGSDTFMERTSSYSFYDSVSGDAVSAGAITHDFSSAYEVSVTGGQTLTLGVESRIIRYRNVEVKPYNVGTFIVLFGTGTVAQAASITSTTYSADEVDGISLEDQAFVTGQNLRDRIIKACSVIDSYLNDSSTGYDDLVTLREEKDKLFALQNSNDSPEDINAAIDAISSTVVGVIGNYQFGFEADAGVPAPQSVLF